MNPLFYSHHLSATQLVTNGLIIRSHLGFAHWLLLQREFHSYSMLVNNATKPLSKLAVAMDFASMVRFLSVRTRTIKIVVDTLHVG